MISSQSLLLFAFNFLPALVSTSSASASCPYPLVQYINFDRYDGTNANLQLAEVAAYGSDGKTLDTSKWTGTSSGSWTKNSLTAPMYIHMSLTNYLTETNHRPSYQTIPSLINGLKSIYQNLNAYHKSNYGTDLIAAPT